MKKLYKLFFSWENALIAVLILAIAIPIAAIAFEATEGDLKISVFIGILTFVIGFIWVVLTEYYGQKKHASFVHHKIFQQLCRELNFEIEAHNNNRYWGLKGTYKRYFFKIFYNWNSSVSNRNFYREITILLYFSPQLNAAGAFDKHFLESLNEKYEEKGYFIPHNFKVTIKASHIEVNRGYSIFTSYENVAKQIERAVQIAHTENLEPIEENKVNELISKNVYLHGPAIETYYEE